MEIHRYIRTDRPDASGRYAVQLTIHFNNTRLRFATGQKVSKAGWDANKEKAKGSEPYYTKINEKLDQLELMLRSAYDNLESHFLPITTETLKKAYASVFEFVKASGEKEITKALLKSAFDNYLHPVEPAPETPALEPASETPGQDPAGKILYSSFFELTETWIKEEEREIDIKTGRKRSKNTIKSLRSSVNKLKEFETYYQKPLTLIGMTIDFYNSFRDWMLFDRVPVHRVNYFGKVTGHLTQFLGWAEKKHDDLVVHKHYKRFEAPSRYIGVDFLLLDELNAIKNLDFKSEEIRKKLDAGYSSKLKDELRADAFQKYLYQVELARDIFLMCCYTGLRISDCQELSRSWILGELIIVEDSTKTDVTCYIPYFNDDLFEPVSIVKKYAGPGDRIFSKCPKINKHLKVVQKLADVLRFELTTKIGRKTFVTMKVYQGVPNALIMQATGHQSERDFRRYLGVNAKELIEAFKSRSITSGKKAGAEMGAEIINTAISA